MSNIAHEPTAAEAGGKWRKPQLAAYCDLDTWHKIEDMQKQYFMVTKSRMIVAAVRYWLGKVERYGLDANLQPLEPHEIS